MYRLNFNTYASFCCVYRYN